MPDQTVAQRHGSPLFYKLLEEMADTHDKKSHDYASNDNPYGNYEFSGELACMFSHSPKDAGFIGRIGEKLYRLANLEKSGKQPKNESIEDTERDICVIVALWIASRRERRNSTSQVSPSLGTICEYCGLIFAGDKYIYNTTRGSYNFCSDKHRQLYVLQNPTPKVRV